MCMIVEAGLASNSGLAFFAVREKLERGEEREFKEELWQI